MYTEAEIVNCTIVGNRAAQGGGTADGTLKNCIVYDNEAHDMASANYVGGSFAYSCTTPRPAGTGNISNAPEFVPGTDELAWNSPCVNAGSNAYTVGAWDLAGTNRILFGTVDMGCYECTVPEPASVIVIIAVLLSVRRHV